MRVKGLHYRRLLCLGLLLIIWFVYSKVCCFQSSDVIVSLTTTSKRFHDELVFTIHSLLTQSVLPKEIRIYLSTNRTLTKEKLRIFLKQVDSSTTINRLFENLVQIKYEEKDYGPATKYLPIIQEFHSKKTFQSQKIVIVDDDHYYHPYTIATLDQYSNQYPNSILGFRGWRIREDLNWGVGENEISFHIIESYRLKDTYRVGILTANHGYLIRPWFFDSHIYQDFAHVSEAIRRVDDIWLNGHASKRNISRLVIPSCCFSKSITRTHELENYFREHHLTRGWANGEALKWFNSSWEKDLWYRFHGVNRPTYRTWSQAIFRMIFNEIFQIKFYLFND